MIIGVFKLGNDQGYLSGDQTITNLGYNQGGILGSFWSTNWDTIWDSYLGSIWSTSWVSIWVQTGEQSVTCLGISQEVSLQHSHRKMPATSWPSARELLSRGATGPALRCNAGQP